MEQLRPQLDLRAGTDLLEVGCGTGQLTGWLRQAVQPGRVTSIDFAPAMIAQARRRLPDADLRVADVCGDCLGTALYDVVLCFHSFPHFRDPAAALANIARALKPGGRLLVIHVAGSAHINALHTGLGGAVGHDHLPRADAWESLLQAADMRLDNLIDREDLFLLQASRGP